MGKSGFNRLFSSNGYEPVTVAQSQIEKLVDEGPAIAVGLVCGRTWDADAAKEPADIQLGYLAVHQRIAHQLFLLGRHGEFLI